VFGSLQRADGALVFGVTGARDGSPHLVGSVVGR
jgi:hypothetical protein